MEFDSKARQIRSFVLRQGKMTTGQRKAVEDLLPKYAIDPIPEQLVFSEIFGNDNPVWLDIGFGNGLGNSIPLESKYCIVKSD